MFRGLRYKEDLFYFLKYLLKQDGLHRAMYTPSSPPPRRHLSTLPGFLNTPSPSFCYGNGLT